jgi:hypothetical protein
MTNQKGGSQASNRVMALLPEQCNVKNLGPISPVQNDNLEGMNFYQTTGGSRRRNRRSNRRNRSNKRSNRRNRSNNRSTRRNNRNTRNTVRSRRRNRSSRRRNRRY